MKGWTNRPAKVPSTVLQKVVEDVEVDDIGLHAHSDVLCHIDVIAAAKAIEACPVVLLPGRDKFLRDGRRDRIVRMWCRRLVHRTDGWPDEQSDIPKLSVVELRACGKSLCGGIHRHIDLVSRRNHARQDELQYLRAELLPARGGQPVRSQLRVARGD